MGSLKPCDLFEMRFGDCYLARLFSKYTCLGRNNDIRVGRNENGLVTPVDDETNFDIGQVILKVHIPWS